MAAPIQRPAMPYQIILMQALAALFIVVGISYFAYSYALNRTNIATRLKRRGFYRCAHYQHKDIFFGSDWQSALSAAAARGIRKEWVQSQFERYGKTFETGSSGRCVFMTCDIINAQALLTASTADVGVGPSRAGLVSWLGPGAFTVDGELWKHSRNMLKPIFKKPALSDMSRMERHLSRLMNEVENQDGIVDLQENFVRMFLDFSMDLLIGEDVNTVNQDFSKVDAHSFIKSCDESQFAVVRLQQPWLIRWWKGWTKSVKKPLEATQAFVDRYVDSAIQDSQIPESGPIQRSPAFIDELIREAGSTNRIYLRNQILNVFMPGRDSVAIMASHVMFHLARHPAVYERLRGEVLAAGFKRGSKSYEDIKSLTYINAVINESLRLGGPPNGVTARDILSDIVLPRGGGVKGDQPLLVPKGATVYVHIQTIHRDEVAWGPDPHSFRPERWIESSKTSQQLAFEWMPFGGGRRICPAMALVLGELRYIVASFAIQFREIQNRDPERRLFEEGAIVMKIRNGVHVRLVQ